MSNASDEPSVVEVNGRDVGLLIPLPGGVQFFAADTSAFACDRWTFASFAEARQTVIHLCRYGSHLDTESPVP